MMADQYPELPVALLRAGNWQLSADKGRSDGNSPCNQTATSDLQAIAISRLQKIRGNKEGNPQATDELPGVQLPPPNESTGVAIPGLPTEGAGRLDWLEWVAGQVPLVKDDRAYVWARLMTLSPSAVEAAAKRYVHRWHEAAVAEPKEHRKENAGRRAANRGLLSLVQPVIGRGGAEPC